MKEKIFTKNLEKGGEKMMKRIFMLTLLLVFGLATLASAATSKSVIVRAQVPTLASELNVIVSKVTPGSDGAPDTWLKLGDSAPMDFGTLSRDNEYYILRGNYYFAVDVGVVDNTGADWQVTHTRTSLKKDTTNNLDDNVNVSFVKQTTTTATDLLKTSYSGSNNKQFTKSGLSGGWLRIYYGIATGKGDNAGVTPVTFEKAYGVYAGNVTITVTP